MFLISEHKKGVYKVFDSEDCTITPVSKRDIDTSIMGVSRTPYNERGKKVKIYPCAVKILMRDTFKDYRDCKDVEELKNKAREKGVIVKEQDGMYRVFYNIERKLKIRK